MTPSILNPSPDAARLYLDFLKQTLTRLVFPERYGPAPEDAFSAWPEMVRNWLRDHNLALVSVKQFDAAARTEGRDWPLEAETMIGLARLNNLQQCIENILRDKIPGDLFEAGVWRGGASIFMRAVLKAYGVTERKVWLADSFQGLPKPDARAFPHDRGDMLWMAPELAVSLESVQENFRRYGLLDDQVAFLPGCFRDTLPEAPVEKIALLRLDGDLYESTMVALRSLYARVPVGGYVIVDDYGALECCKAAVEDFRAEFGIREELRAIDWAGVYWRVERPIPRITSVWRETRVEARAERTSNVEYEPALHTLLVLYDSRPDLQKAFPEAAGWDFRRLIDWAWHAAKSEFPDGSAPALSPFLDWFQTNRVEVTETGNLDCGKRDQLAAVSMVIREFELRQIVEIGTGKGDSTVALLQAADAVGGRLLSLDIEPCRPAHELVEASGFASRWTFLECNAVEVNDSTLPPVIDLLFVDTFQLYSEIPAELQRFAARLRRGSWIAIRNTAMFPGAAKALTNTIDSFSLNARVYTFAEQNGLSLARIVDSGNMSSPI